MQIEVSAILYVMLGIGYVCIAYLSYLAMTIFDRKTDKIYKKWDDLKMSGRDPLEVLGFSASYDCGEKHTGSVLCAIFWPIVLPAVAISFAVASLILFVGRGLSQVNKRIKMYLHKPKEKEK